MVSSEAAGQVNYATTALSLFILVARIVLSLWRRERIDTSFALVVTSVVFVLARIIANVYYLRYGNAADAIKHAGYFEESNLDDVKTGSILVLVARALITIIIWLQICILLIFYSRITRGVNWVATIVKITWATVAATFLAIMLVTFLECRPISLYWQITPDPGQCVQAYGQLFTQSISNVVLDILLIITAYPIVMLRKRTMAEYITLYTLFALGTFCIIISIIRLVSVRDSDSAQTTRSLWGSVQMFVSTFVANAPNIYGSIRALRIKKSTQGKTPPQYGYHLDTVKSKRLRPVTDSWMRMDDEPDLDDLTPHRQSVIRPLPPAATFYDDGNSATPYSHQTSSLDSISDQSVKPHYRTTEDSITLDATSETGLRGRSGTLHDEGH
ncbi:hypothetical protein F5Y09DRAFT_344568 [Xylaria sp. FL1042]|nr:hypothetical protein F5Y09DRAFT_344568 [Xylaria sp. FL1042]